MMADFRINLFFFLFIVFCLKAVKALTVKVEHKNKITLILMTHRTTYLEREFNFQSQKAVMFCRSHIQTNK